MSDDYGDEVAELVAAEVAKAMAALRDQLAAALRPVVEARIVGDDEADMCGQCGKVLADLWNSQGVGFCVGCLGVIDFQAASRAGPGDITTLRAAGGDDGTAVLTLIERIHRTNGLAVEYCEADGQPWPCPTRQAFDPAALAEEWGRWHALPVSRAARECQECGEAARVLPKGGGAILKHQPWCYSEHAREVLVMAWRNRIHETGSYL